MLLGEGSCVILFGPGTLYCLTVCHARVMFIDERMIDLAVNIVSMYMHFGYGATNILEVRCEVRQVSSNALGKVDMILAPDVITDGYPPLISSFWAKSVH